MTTNSNDNISVRTLAIAIFISIAGTIGVLEWQGKILHPEASEQYALASYKVVFIPTEEESTYRLSPKPSHQTAFCESGYLFVRNDKDADMQGLLVDYKNRGVRCSDQAKPLTEDHTAPSNSEANDEG